MTDLLAQIYLKIDNKDASQAIMNNLISVEVDDSVLLPAMFSICLLDLDFNLTDSQDFALGKKIEILIKEPSDREPTQLFKGEITAIEPEFYQSNPTVLIRGYDMSHRLHRLKQTKSYIQMSDSDIVSKVASECGLRVNADSTSGVHQFICQNNQTAMEFLQERAKLNGYYLYVEDDVLCFKKSLPGGSTVATLEWGNNLREFG